MSVPARSVLLSRLLTHSGDQAWDFAVPMALVMIFPGQLDLVALYYLLVRLVHTALVSRVCATMDRWDPLRVIRIGISAQTLGVAGAAVAMMLLARQRDVDAPAFAALIIAGIASSLGSSLMAVAVSQDWIPTIVPPAELSHVNSRLKQIDLLTEVSAPVVAGLLLAWKPSVQPLAGFFAVVLWNILSFLPEYILLRRVYVGDTDLSQRAPRIVIARKEGLLRSLQSGWRSFLAHPAAAVMIAYALLWITILSPHGVLLAAWLESGWHLPEAVIGMFRGLGAVFGLIATFAFPWVLRRLSLVGAARAFIIFEAVCLVGAGVAFWIGPTAAPAFIACILLSRIGLYGFSLGETEIRQRAIAPEQRGRINGVAQALTSLATLAVYGAGVALGESANFSLLIYGSIAFVVLAAIVFSAWTLTKAQLTAGTA